MHPVKKPHKQLTLLCVHMPDIFENSKFNDLVICAKQGFNFYINNHDFHLDHTNCKEIVWCLHDFPSDSSLQQQKNSQYFINKKLFCLQRKVV